MTLHLEVYKENILLVPTAISATFIAIVFLVVASSTQAQTTIPQKKSSYGAELQGFNYTYPVHTFDFTSQGKKIQMAYVDVAPSKTSKPNNRTAVLLHGKLFCADTWSDTIKFLSNSGFRVIAPDQVGFCKSTKPESYQYSFQQLASNTHALLQNLGITRSTMVGHSMGGMLAIRYSLMYPETTEQLALINPIGLEDWKALGVPYVDIDTYYAEELTTTAQGLKQYHSRVDLDGGWRPEFDRLIEMQSGMYNGPGLPLVARNAALISDMVYSQPVFYELEKLQTPTVLLMGLKDRTAITNGAPPAVRARLGNYKVLGKAAVARIPAAKLVEFDDLAHSPHLQAPERFYPALLQALNQPK